MMESAIQQIDRSELETFRKTYEEQSRRGAPSAVAQFSYAHALIKSNKNDIRLGIFLLENLLDRNIQYTQNRHIEYAMKHEYRYYLAVAHTRIEEYERALHYIGFLLTCHNDVDLRKLIDLKELIESRMKKEIADPAIDDTELAGVVYPPINSSHDGMWMGLTLLGLGGVAAFTAWIYWRPPQ